MGVRFHSHSTRRGEVMKNLTEEDEFDAVSISRRRVIAMSILNGARTPAQIRTVAASIGEADYGDDVIVRQILSDYWDA